MMEPLIRLLLDERADGASICLPQGEAGQRRPLRALMNLRPPWPAAVAPVWSWCGAGTTLYPPPMWTEPPCGAPRARCHRCGHGRHGRTATAHGLPGCRITGRCGLACRAGAVCVDGGIGEVLAAMGREAPRPAERSQRMDSAATACYTFPSGTRGLQLDLGSL